jgi:MoaA/NifB/PqqE/SkfB family radical SAM enzyme
MCVKRTLNTPHGQRPFSDFKTLVDKLPYARDIWLGALGDPFSYNDPNALRYLHSKKIASPTTSNLALVNEKNVNIIPPNQIIHISIDGGSSDMYERIRGQKLSKLKENIDLVMRLRPDIHFCINYLIFKDNILDGMKIIDYAQVIKSPISFFLPIYFKPELEKEMSMWNLDYARIISEMNELANYARTSNVQISITSPSKRERPCMRAFTQPIIAYDGSVYPCDYAYQNMNDWDGEISWDSWYNGIPYKVPQSNYKMGNLYQDDFITLWNSPKWKKLRSKLFDLNHLVMTNQTKFMNYENAVNQCDPNDEFSHCDRCLARWSRCL